MRLGVQVMTQQQLNIAINRIERALSRIEQAPVRPLAGQNDVELAARHERLKAETKLAISDIDDILRAGAN